MLWCCSDSVFYLECQIITGYAGSRTNSQRTGFFRYKTYRRHRGKYTRNSNTKKGICEEIHKIRKSLNDHLDQLQETLIRSINKTVDDVTLQLGDVKNILTEIERETSDITLEFNKIKEHASDLQAFLSLPHLISKASDEEKNVEKLGSKGKFNFKSIIFTARIDEIIKMKSIGDVGVDDINSNVAYVKEKEKQAQIVGPLTRRTNDK